jgi:hypothetical protein
VPIEWFTAFPHQLIDEYELDPDEDAPYLQVLQRLPD